jgi:hypothetical protein
MHGATHASGGSDPIPGGTGGGAKRILACWAGALPTSVGNGLVWRVPYDSDGGSFTFALARAFARIEATHTAGVAFVLEKSPGGDVPFSASAITTVTISAGDYEAEDTSVSDSVDSGDLLRLRFGAVGASTNYQVELLGSE